MATFPTLDFLQVKARYPKSVEKIKEWIFSQPEFNSEDFVDANHPEESKEQFTGLLIQMDPRKLYDIFDSFGIYISISYTANVWIFHNNKDEAGFSANSRHEAEQSAFHDAFEILEKTL